METISGVLTWIFTYIFYPVIILGIFVFIGFLITSIVSESKDKPRVITGAVLPFLSLIFIVVSSKSNGDPIVELLKSYTPITTFIVGAVVGIFLLELGRILLKVKSSIAEGMYALFLSSILVFMLYSIMTGLIKELHVPLFGFVIFSGLDILFRGMPE